MVFYCRVHICITLNHTKPGVIDEFLRDLAVSAEELINNPELSQESRTAAIYGTHLALILFL